MIRINIYKYKIMLKTIKIKYLIKRESEISTKNQREKTIDINKNTVN